VPPPVFRSALLLARRAQNPPLARARPSLGRSSQGVAPPAPPDSPFKVPFGASLPQDRPRHVTTTPPTPPSSPNARRSRHLPPPKCAHFSAPLPKGAAS